MWTRRELKEKGKAAFKANYWPTVLVAIVLVLVSGAASGGYSGSNSSQQITDAINQASSDTGVDAAAIAGAVAAAMGVLVLVLSAIQILIFNPLQVGCQKFFLNNSEGHGAIGDMADGFKDWARKMVAMLLRDIFIVLWSCLFIIPGIIKSYSYRMVPFILADDPTIGGTEAITRSREMMNGHKWNAFVLDLSFIGWEILSVLTVGILGVFYVNPYYYSTNAELYRALKNGTNA